MRSPAILIILIAFILASCQTNAKDVAANLNENSADIKPITLPTPTASHTPKEKGKFDIHRKIGIVDVHSDEPSCLRTKNGDLAEKTPISIIVSLAEPPQKVLTALVEKKLGSSCARHSSEIGDKNPGENYFYSLTLNEKFDDYEVGIAVIQSSKPIKVKNNLASIDLNEDGKLEYFRRCTSFEGLYFTIWTGKPLIGKRIWDSFYYLDYDTKKDCKKREYKRNED